MEYLYLVALLIFLFTFFMWRSPRLNNPKHVLQEVGDDVLILHTPLARLWPSQGKRINKHKAARIQKAGNIVTLFSHSSNAIDITLSQKHSALVFDRACLLFPSAEKGIV
ncbi:hypothetical protein [Alteromonas stellipolaris]|uniref:hypothetical protein n=1 Tax=Alteromonas stellipolaris TaxID=233316 RepID=UPI0027371A83|nr:hypothetical protein [Alteromonas stellipolaris]MDP2596185.1 hypothetical protein [Alteromonas stellipolaris]